MIAKVREYSHSEVVELVSEFHPYLQEKDNFGIVRHMKVMVPEFRSKNSVYEQLDKEMVGHAALG